jgi:hypothetical protein
MVKNKTAVKKLSWYPWPFYTKEKYIYYFLSIKLSSLMTIWKPDKSVPTTNNWSGFRMPVLSKINHSKTVLVRYLDPHYICPVFEWLLNTRPLILKTQINHLNTRLVRYSGGHCFLSVFTSLFWSFLHSFCLSFILFLFLLNYSCLSFILPSFNSLPVLQNGETFFVWQTPGHSRPQLQPQRTLRSWTRSASGEPDLNTTC